MSAEEQTEGVHGLRPPCPQVPVKLSPVGDPSTVLGIAGYRAQPGLLHSQVAHTHIAPCCTTPRSALPAGQNGATTKAAVSLEAALQRIAQLESENEDLRSDALERDAILAQSREFIASTLAGFKLGSSAQAGP